MRPFLFDNLLFDGVTPSPLCARALPFSKQLPANDTQMAKEFVAAALGVTFRNFLAPRLSRKTIWASPCRGWERRDAARTRGVNREFSPLGPPRTDGALCDMAVKTLADCLTNKLVLRAHTQSQAQIVLSTPLLGILTIIINTIIISSGWVRIFSAFILKFLSNWGFFFFVLFFGG